MVSSRADSAAHYLPARRDLDALRRAARRCQGCPLYASATQTVFGEGPANAQLVFIGEQPGDVEDRLGRPFAGPAGMLFEEMLAEVEIPRQSVYVTNAVKHFKWKPRGKRRMHAKPSSREIMACQPWLEAELSALQPEMLVCLGATAAQSLFGSNFRLTKRRGQPFQSEWAPWTLATYHPSAILRASGFSGGAEVREQFRADLKRVAQRFRR